MNREPRHSVLMITYNQDKYVAAALDSVLIQVPLPYEVIVSDDASTDNTWSIIGEYREKFPSLIKAKRNKENIGIYQNINSILKSATGDVVSFLSGDDLFEPGLFKELNRVISENEIDLDADDFVIITNFKFLWRNGSTTIYNNYRLKKDNIFKQRIRYGVFYREIGISRNIIEKIDYARTDLGLHADWLFALDIDAKCKMHYFTPFVSSTYRTGVGIVKKTDVEDSRKLHRSRINTILAIKSKFSSKLDAKDIGFLEYEACLCKYLIEDNFEEYVKLLSAFLRNVFNFPRNNPFYDVVRLSMLLPPKIRTFLKTTKRKLLS